MDEVAVSDMLNEELNIDSDNEMVLEIQGETASKKSNNEKPEVRVK